MKTTAAIAIFSFLSFSGVAAAQLDCSDVDTLGESLIELGEWLDGPAVEIGSGDDHGLAQIVLDLAKISDLAGLPGLGKASVAMANAWANADQDALQDGLAEAVVSLAAVSAASNCE